MIQRVATASAAGDRRQGFGGILGIDGIAAKASRTYPRFMPIRRQSPRPPRPHRLLMLAFPVAQSLDIAGPLEVFAAANATLAAAGGSAFYELTLAAAAAGPLATSCGIPFCAGTSFHAPGLRPDTLLLAGGEGARRLHDARSIGRIRRLAEAAPRVATVCTGVFPLAATGLLDGRRVATHWRRCAMLAARYPALEVDADAIFVSDGKFHTSAGVTAGIDLALALVEQDLGRPLALAVARQLVVFLKRPGGQSQFSGQLRAQTEQAADARFAALGRWMLDHLQEDLSVDCLAARAAMSPRNFARRFAAEVGAPPGKYVQQIRLDAARRLLTEGELPIGEIARRCGFGTPETLRIAFQRQLKVAPQQFRARFSRPATVKEALR